MDWAEHYNTTLGLWSSSGPGHTLPTKDLETVHAGPNAASRLLAAAQVGALGEIDVARVLSALREMVWEEDDGRRGCMQWYREEDQPYDTNAAFFTGLSLIVLRKLYYDALDQASRTTLDDILGMLTVWFDHAVEHATVHYPNKFLGDLVCAWLLLEISGSPEDDARVGPCMRRSADYWLENGWGWGEHLSDIYTGVCLNELSVLLLLSEKLPDDLRDRYTKLVSALLAIEDAYDGGPRVPALRSYAFQAPRTHVNYRDRVKPWETTPERFGNSPDLGNLLHGLGWHEKMPTRGSVETDPVVACFDGATARAHLEDDVRIGSVSRFPVMPSAEHPTWGLSWQCFPVAVSGVDKDWGFLQWEVLEAGVKRAHPANGGPMAHIPKALTEATSAPVFGRTYAIQRGGDLLALRLMRIVPTAWDSLADRFRIVDQSGEVRSQIRDGWSTLALGYPERTVGVHNVTLTHESAPDLTENEFGGSDWTITHPSPDLHRERLVVHLWALSIDGPVEEAPTVEVVEHGPRMARTQEEAVREVTWTWPNTAWRVRIDPLAETPLVEIGQGPGES